MSVIEFLQSGWQINMMCAIDFTSSNGEKFDPHSLHFIDPYKRMPNQYEQAILQVGSILEDYATD